MVHDSTCPAPQARGALARPLGVWGEAGGMPWSQTNLWLLGGSYGHMETTSFASVGTTGSQGLSGQSAQGPLLPAAAKCAGDLPRPPPRVSALVPWSAVLGRNFSGVGSRPPGGNN